MAPLLLALLAALPFTPEELLATRRPDDVQVSPDGKWASVTLRQKSLSENRDTRDIWLIPLSGKSAPLQFTRNGHSEHARFSPDGKSLLVQRDGQLWLYDLAGGDPRQVTSLSGGAQAGVFSPSGRFIAYQSDVYPGCAGQTEEVDDCDKRRAAEVESAGVKARVIDHLFARHWTEWKEGKRTHLFIQPATGGQARDVTPGDQDWPGFNLGGGDDYAFGPGDELVVASKPAAREAWSTNGDLWALERTGKEPRNLTAANKGNDNQPRFSPDGKYLAWTAQARDGYESDQIKLKIMRLEDGRTVTAALDEDAGAIAWRRDSKGLVVSVVQKARLWLEQVALDGRHERLSADPAGADFDLMPDGSAVAVVAGITRPPEVWRFSRDGKPQKLTSFNDAQYARLDLGALDEQWTDSQDGSKVHSWLLKPPGLGKSAPLLLLIHGGPESSWEDAWTMRWNAAVFAARGYVVLMPDPHGSLGYGQKFKEEIGGDWGGLPYTDLMTAVDAAEKLPFVTPGKTCAAGASFGGYMVDWINGHTDRFKCLVSHDGVFDLVSSYGSTEELWFPEWEFKGPYWEQPELYAKFSPSHYVQNFKTPTLVVQGELDFRVSVEQGLGMFSALQRRGIESRLLWFPDEGHWVLKPRNSRLWYHTVLDWIDAHARSTSQGDKPHAQTPPRSSPDRL